MRRSIWINLGCALTLVFSTWAFHQPIGLQAAPQATLTIVVNSGGDGNTRDSVLTLREAILIARGTLWQCLTDGEKAQIFDAQWTGSAGCWNIANVDRAQEADWIIFANGTTLVTPTSELPALYCLDKLTSGFTTTRAVTITGVAAGNATGLVLECPNANANITVQYLTIRNFARSGIYGSGIQTATLSGLQINNNAMSGLYFHHNSGTSRNSRSLTLGAANAYDRNFIFGNGGDGIYLEGTSAYDSGFLNHKIQNSYIGVDSGGVTDQGNAGSGVHFVNVWYSTVGGSTANLGNVISGNNVDGVKIEGEASTGNGVFNNIIGLNVAATAKIGNSASGIALLNGADNNLIGTTSANGNLIGGNNHGIFIADFGTDSNSVAYNRIGTNATNDSGLGNTTAGVGLYNLVAFNEIGSNGGNTISGNGIGVDIANNGTNFNNVRNNKIGTDSSGTIGRANLIGVKISGGSKYNDVGFNTISNNGLYGVQLDGAGTMSNTVRANQIGTTSTGAAALGNQNGLILSGGASYNSIGTTTEGNTISGNIDTGVIISGTNTSDNSLRKNLIGTNLSGTAALPNGFGVVVRSGAHHNAIGEDNYGNTISGNTYDGLRLIDANTAANRVYSNTIGLNAAATARLGNGWSGVAIFGGAVGNYIGDPDKGNIISGNDGGVYVAGASTMSNLIVGNTIGTNWSAAAGLGNTNQGVGLYYNANFNFVGVATPNYGNLISGNGGPGVDIGHSANGNFVWGNYIGTNAAGTAPLSNSIGIRLWDGAAQNMIGDAISPAGRNLISGNGSYGIGVYDANTISNTIAGNYLGTDSFGAAQIANANGGVLVQLAGSTVISSNLVSGNTGSGISLDGARDTRLENNRVGTTANGLAALGNTGHGVHVSNTAVRNTIGSTTTLAGRNLISGNGSHGVSINSALTTTVEFNLIGLDSSGAAPLPNGDLGIGVYYSTNTLLGPNGGQGKYQYVSGNGGHGIYVVNSTETYIGYSNRIGFATDDSSPIGNSGSGVVLNGTQNSAIHALIGHNGDLGVVALGAASNNRITPLINRANGGLPIDLGDDGATPNDPGDVDTGPNGLLNYPVITATTGSVITGTACANCTIYIYERFGNPRAAGGGAQFTGQYALTNGAGVWNVTLAGGLKPISVTLQTCQGDCANSVLYANTSEFSPIYAGSNNVYLPLILR